MRSTPRRFKTPEGGVLIFIETSDYDIGSDRLIMTSDCGGNRDVILAGLPAPLALRHAGSPCGAVKELGAPVLGPGSGSGYRGQVTD